ncbi:MAG TPA: hypothetical protein VFG66_08795 [Gemmatimonadales bacterium]|nr:hypothetical protein [Gemmatimonadales bacterium]
MAKQPKSEPVGAAGPPASRLLRLPLAGQVEILIDRYVPGCPATSKGGK